MEIIFLERKIQEDCMDKKISQFRLVFLGNQGENEERKFD